MSDYKIHSVGLYFIVNQSLQNRALILEILNSDLFEFIYWG